MPQNIPRRACFARLAGFGPRRSFLPRFGRKPHPRAAASRLLAGGLRGDEEVGASLHFLPPRQRQRRNSRPRTSTPARWGSHRPIHPRAREALTLRRFRDFIRLLADLCGARRGIFPNQGAPGEGERGAEARGGALTTVPGSGGRPPPRLAASVRRFFKGCTAHLRRITASRRLTPQGAPRLEPPHRHVSSAPKSSWYLDTGSRRLRPRSPSER